VSFIDGSCAIRPNLYLECCQHAAKLTHDTVVA